MKLAILAFLYCRVCKKPYWDQFKDHLYYICLDAAAVASWSLIQEVAYLSDFFTNLFSLNSLKTFRENSFMSERE